MRRKPPLPTAPLSAPSVQSAVLDALATGRQALEAPAKSHAVRIHDFRKALKRLRALLRLMNPVVGDEAQAIRVQARDLARELAGTRDSQSALDAIRDLHKGRSGGELSERSMKTISGKLAQLKQSSRHAQLSADIRLRLLTWIDSTDARVRMWPPHSPDFSVLAQELTRNYRRARRALPDKWPEAGDEALHELRQRVIVHRNQLDLIEPLHPKLVKKWINAAQRIRSRLGRYQDLTLLVRLCEPGQPLAPWRIRLQNDVRKRQHDHLEAVQRSTTKFFEPSPKSFRKRVESLGGDRG